MNMFKTIIPVLVMGLSGVAMAEGSVQNFANSAKHGWQASKHSAQATGDALIGTTQVVSAVAAVPFKLVGAVATTSNKVGDALWDNARGQQSEELEVSDEVVTAGPAPYLAMAQ